MKFRIDSTFSDINYYETLKSQRQAENIENSQGRVSSHILRNLQYITSILLIRYCAVQERLECYIQSAERKKACGRHLVQWLNRHWRHLLLECLIWVLTVFWASFLLVCIQGKQQLLILTSPGPAPAITTFGIWGVNSRWEMLLHSPSFSLSPSNKWK